MSNIKSYFIRGTQWIYRIAALPLLGSISKLRIGSGAGEHQIQVPKGLHWASVDASEVRCEWMIPPDATTDAVLLYLHGGGGVLGLYNSSRKMIGHIALACDLRVLIPDYRLAPEYPFPAGMNDCVVAYRWLLSEGFKPQQIVIAGDSIGGYLTICTLLVLRDNGQPLPAAAVCISPNTDLTCNGKTMQTNALRDALLSPKFARTMASLYVGNHDMSDPHISPLLADLHGLPPILIQAGADEILLDDSRRFSDNALAAGVELTLEIWPHMWHDWHSCVPDLAEANQAIGRIAEFVNKYI
ncbi:MAG: alpha/beta hydrolase [Anaerolineales bacterium]|nr:alpha/beta hydrolase [Anaerolineales bacterium]